MLFIMPCVRTIAVINQKGGVGKTTTVANLGAAIAARGHSICLIDLDPQSHLTLHLGVEPTSTQAGVYELLTDSSATFAQAVVKVSDKLSLVPAVIDLAAAEVELAGTIGREQILRDKLADAGANHNFVMIDCAPSLGLLTLNALAAADDVLIPLQPHFLALQGLGKLLETVSLVQKRINPRLRVAGVVLCMWESNTRLSGEVLADLQGFFDASRGSSTPWANAQIFQNMVRRNVKLAECPSYGKTIFDYEPASRGAEDHWALADEILAALKATSPSAPQASTLPQDEAQPSPLPQEASPVAENPAAAQAPVQQAEQSPDESIANDPPSHNA